MIGVFPKLFQSRLRERRAKIYSNQEILITEEIPQNCCKLSFNFKVMKMKIEMLFHSVYLVLHTLARCSPIVCIAGCQNMNQLWYIENSLSLEMGSICALNSKRLLCFSLMEKKLSRQFTITGLIKHTETFHLFQFFVY